MNAAVVRATLALVLSLTAAACQSAPGRGGGDLLALKQKADQAYDEGRMLDAERYYQRILEEAPNTAQVWFRLGNINLRVDRLEAAVHAFRQCLTYDRNDVRCWNNLSVAYVQMAAATLEQGSEQVGDPAAAAQLDVFRRRIIDSINREKSEAP